MSEEQLSELNNELHLFLRDIQLTAANQLTMLQRFTQNLQDDNNNIYLKLKEQLTKEIKNTLEENLKKNNQLLHLLFELQNHILNNDRYFEWLKLELDYENRPMKKEENQNKLQPTLEDEAQKARLY